MTLDVVNPSTLVNGPGSVPRPRRPQLKRVACDECKVTLDDGSEYWPHQDECFDMLPITGLTDIEELTMAGLLQDEMDALQGDPGVARKIKDLSGKQFEVIIARLARLVKAWNWTDLMTAKALDPPSVATITPLTIDEILFLVNRTTPSRLVERKNGSGPTPTTSSDTPSTEMVNFDVGQSPTKES